MNVEMPRKRFLFALGATLILWAFHTDIVPPSKVVAYAVVLCAFVGLVLAIFNAAERADGRS